MNYLQTDIVVIGLGYVGLPLAVNLSKKFQVIGYDISDKRINDLKRNIDTTKEVSEKSLKASIKLSLTNKLKEISNKYIYIITVPTPVNKNKLPNLSYIESACQNVGSIMSKEAIVIFESTVYPGVTEKVCGPILEKRSGYKLNKGFFLGYSPERINPGDKKHSVEKIVKVVSGSNKKVSKIIGKIYEKIIKAGVFYAKSIEVAETAKAIENAQRDINIAFINEIALLCQKLDISVYDVLDAAKTKWNFLPFTPGLVGGHCIGVDPYYLAHVAKNLGTDTNVILAGRNMNDSMTEIVFNKINKVINKKQRVLQLGVSFKENIPDIRNSKAAELAQLFIKKKFKIDIYDPIVNKNEFKNEYNITLRKPRGKYEHIIIAVPHDYLKIFNKNVEAFLKKDASLYDLTGKYKNKLNKHDFKYWSF